MLTPEHYMSTSNGVWRVICQGMPLCADTSRELAEKVARHYGYTPETMAIWNGDRGEFIPAPAVSA